MTMDLQQLDRDVQKTARRYEAAMRGLYGGEKSVDPFEGARHVSSRATVTTLLASTPSLFDEPMRNGLADWIAFLTIERVSFEDVSKLAGELSSERVRLREKEVTRECSINEGWKTLLVRPAHAREEVLSAIAAETRSLFGRARDLVERRAEAWKQLGQPGLLERELRFRRSLLEFARTILAKTNDLAADLIRKRAKQENVELLPLLAAGDLALASEATLGWPQELTARWVKGLFVSPLEERSTFAVPKAMNGASFLRAFERFGEFLVRRAPVRLFASHVAPLGLEARTLGALFGVLPSRAIFLRRALDLGADAAVKQARCLETATFFELRRRALVEIARHGETLEPYAELARGGEPFVSLFALSQPLGVDARLFGWITLLDFEERVRERFDEDWFKNPRLGPFLREPLTAGVIVRPELNEETSTAMAHRLSAAFEKGLTA